MSRSSAKVREKPVAVCRCGHLVSEHSGYPDGAITYCLVLTFGGDAMNGDPPEYCMCGDYLERGSEK